MLLCIIDFAYTISSTHMENEKELTKAMFSGSGSEAHIAGTIFHLGNNR
jgi:hypothetical protein